MLRYLLISAAIVIGGTMLVAAWVERDLIRFKLASVYLKVPPKSERAQALVAASPRPLSIEAPWALSVLPACLIQMSDTTGPAAYVLAHLPAGARVIAPPASLTYGNCTILLRGDEAYVRRGADRFHIPPHVQFFRAGEALALLRRDGPGMDLRIYQPPPR
jgi:hypothetical protein